MGFTLRFIKYNEEYSYYKLEEYIFLFHNYDINKLYDKLLWVCWRSFDNETLYWFLIMLENDKKYKNEILLNDFFDNIIGSNLINRSEYGDNYATYKEVSNIFKALIRKEKITKLFSK